MKNSNEDHSNMVLSHFKNKLVYDCILVILSDKVYFDVIGSLVMKRKDVNVEKQES